MSESSESPEVEHFDVLLDELESHAAGSENTTLLNTNSEVADRDAEEQDERMEIAAQVPFGNISGARFSFFYTFTFRVCL